MCVGAWPCRECQLSRQSLRKTSSAKEPMRRRGLARMWKAERHSDRLLAVSRSLCTLLSYVLHCSHGSCVMCAVCVCDQLNVIVSNQVKKGEFHRAPLRERRRVLISLF